MCGSNKYIDNKSKSLSFRSEEMRLIFQLPKSTVFTFHISVPRVVFNLVKLNSSKINISGYYIFSLKAAHIGVMSLIFIYNLLYISPIFYKLFLRLYEFYNQYLYTAYTWTVGCHSLSLRLQ